MDNQPQTVLGPDRKSVTILVAIYKAGKFIEAKLKNIRSQSIFDDCYVVLLNCQNLDNEADIYRQFVEDHDNIIEMRYDEHVRLYPTWNDGIRVTNSEFICNANVDDHWNSEYLNLCTAFLRGNSEYACVSSETLITYEPNQFDHRTWVHKKKMPVGTYPKTTAGPCPVWRRSLHDKYGYFGNYRTIGDARMWEKWHAGGEKFGLINRELVLYYASGLSLERRVDMDLHKSYRELDLEEERGITYASPKTTTPKKEKIG